MISLRKKAVAGTLLAGGAVIAASFWLRSRDETPAVPSGTAPPTPAETHDATHPAAAHGIPPGGSPEIIGSVGAHILSRRHDLTDPAVRADVVRLLRAAKAAERKVTEEKAKRLGFPLVDPAGGVLAGFHGDIPLYESSENADAAISIAADLVRDTFPFNVNGAGYSIGQWEVGGYPRSTHEEFNGRVTIEDSGGAPNNFHATHVTGTLVAAGMTPSVEGIASAASVLAYSTREETTEDEVEMTAIAAAMPNEPGKIYVSNHSYGFTTGWTTTSSTWYGTFDDDGNPANDYPHAFGQYSSMTAEWDGIAWNAPYYLIFKSGGNDRNDNHPGNGQTWRLNSSSGQAFTYDSASHPLADFEYNVSGAINGFGTVGQRGAVKNAVTVGAVNDAVSGGVRAIASATLTPFSAFGPTDDGRIKPDIVANGQGLVSTSNTGNTAIAPFSGTSMASPGACASALLLQDYYDDRFPADAMLSSTLKALMIHTADDLDNPGPDYKTGWGLLNAGAGATVIKDHADTPNEGRLREDRLSPASPSRTLPLIWNGADPIRVTLCWTDPPGVATSVHDDRAPRLVHDLNLKVTAPAGATDHFPWVMPWVGDWTDAMLNANAVTGVNTVDNVEQVFIAAPTLAGEYTITVDHAGALSQPAGSPSQDYSLIVSGGIIPRGGYALWAAEKYPGQWHSAATGGFGADPEMDRIPNGVEYAFDLDTSGFEISPDDIYTVGEETVGPDTFITVIFERDTTKTDIAYEVEWSTDMVHWNVVASAVIATNGDIETRKASIPKDGTRKFARMKITQISN